MRSQTRTLLDDRRGDDYREGKESDGVRGIEKWIEKCIGNENDVVGRRGT